MCGWSGDTVTDLLIEGAAPSKAAGADEGDEELMARSQPVDVDGEAVGDRYKPSMLRHRAPNKMVLDEPGEAEGDRYKPGMLQLGSPNKLELGELGVAAGDGYKPGMLQHGTPDTVGGRYKPGEIPHGAKEMAVQRSRGTGYATNDPRIGERAAPLKNGDARERSDAGAL